MSKSLPTSSIKIIKKELLSNFDMKVESIEFLSKGSNYVYKVLAGDKKKFVVKTENVGIYKFSPLWNMLRDVFGLDLRTLYMQQPLVSEKISRTDMNAPKIWVYEGGLGYTAVCSYIEGENIEEDEFPDLQHIHSNIGDFIGSLHSVTFSQLGNLITSRKKDKHTFLTNLRKSYEMVATKF